MKSKNIFESFKYAFTGLISSVKSERNMKIHFLAMLIVIIMGFIYHISLNEWIYCLICFGLVISSEMVNTSLETVTNIAMPEIDSKAKLAKDIAAGSVLIMALISLIIGLMIFIPKIFN